MLHQLTNIVLICLYTHCGCIYSAPNPYTGFEYPSQHPLPSRILFKRKQAVEMWVNKSFSGKYNKRSKNLNGMRLCQTFLSRWIKVGGVVVSWGFCCCCCGCQGFFCGGVCLFACYGYHWGWLFCFFPSQRCCSSEFAAVVLRGSLSPLNLEMCDLGWQSAEC